MKTNPSEAEPARAVETVPSGSDAAIVSSRTWWLLAVLTAVYTLNFVDRKLPFILIEDIKRDLDLSDTQIGVLTGVLFTFVYTVSGLATGRLADRFDRKLLMTIAVAFWSVMTSLGGFAQSFWTLAASRVGLAMGESACAPAAHSMITDAFPRRMRATAAAIFVAGAPIGMMTGLAVGGYIADLADWRMAMFVMLVPGIVLALVLALTVREPARTGITQSVEKASFLQITRILFSTPTFRHLSTGSVVSTLAKNGTAAFTAAYMMRNFNLSTAYTGLAFGLIVGMAGITGSVGGGYISDFFRQRDARWGLWSVSIAMAVSAPFLIGAWYAPSVTLMLALLIVPHLAALFYAGASYSTVQALVPANGRATAVSIYVLLINGIGVSLGPVLVGLLSDLFAPRMGPDSLRFALVIVSTLTLWGAVHYYIAGRRLTVDLANAGAGA